MRYFLSLSAALLLLACSSTKKQTATAGTGNAFTLSGTSWTLHSLPGFQMEETRKPVTLDFSDTSDRISGFAGCNGYGGVYKVEGKTIKMEKIIATQMACSPGMQTENKVMDALMNADSYHVTAENLTLMKGGKVVATFSKSKKEEK